MIALTDGQDLVFAIVGLLAVVVCMLLPACRQRRSPDRREHHRLMKEIATHEPSD